MAAQPQHNPVSEAIAQALQGVDPSRGQRTAFDLARCLRGVIARFSLNVGFDQAGAIIRHYAESHGLDFEDLHAEVCLAWDAVLVPEGMDPVEAAAMAAANTGIPECFFSKRPEKVRRLLWLTLGIARQLSGDGRRVFFVSARKLGKALERDHMTASRLLALLSEEGFLEQVGHAGKTKAQRYRLKKCYRGTEEQRTYE